MEMAHGHDVDTGGVEAGILERGHDPGAFVAPHRPVLVVEPVADPGLDQDATGRCLDQEAVQRLEEAVLGVQFVMGPAIPQQAGYRAEQRASVRAKGARLDEGDRDATAQVKTPVDVLVQSRRSVSGAVGTRDPLKSR
jgi:hypothetical protein